MEQKVVISLILSNITVVIHRLNTSNSSTITGLAAVFNGQANDLASRLANCYDGSHQTLVNRVRCVNRKQMHAVSTSSPQMNTLTCARRFLHLLSIFLHDPLAKLLPFERMDGLCFLDLAVIEAKKHAGIYQVMTRQY